MGGDVWGSGMEAALLASADEQQCDQNSHRSAITEQALKRQATASNCSSAKDAALTYIAFSIASRQKSSFILITSDTVNRSAIM